MSLLPELLQAALLMLFASASAVRIGLARRGYDEPRQPALFCALLAFGLAAGVGICAVARLALGLDTFEAERWLLRATLLLGVPLIGLVALTFARRWSWSRPTWGRIVLGLCAFFELARQLGWSDPYALALGLFSGLLIIYAGLLQGPVPRQTAAGILGGMLLLASLPWTGLAIGSNPLADYQQLCLALACPLIAWLLLKLPLSAKEQSLEQA
ncbi:hypothetical protein [Pseudomonas saudiphocaensis]|uniref:Uncharacterized protein n=1 Tax=Pseudomonas saudiphocaensis TaxID=1499686 RepID=A0A078LTR7_9PSED|nr:hypothetical protein [Pseudomonas saudiphocaensis]CDZ94554.1 hypothetical protein BN1079_01877 [Pseudomonas saudiphocaensis]